MPIEDDDIVAGGVPAEEMDVLCQVDVPVCLPGDPDERERTLLLALNPGRGLLPTMTLREMRAHLGIRPFTS